MEGLLSLLGKSWACPSDGLLVIPEVEINHLRVKGEQGMPFPFIFEEKLANALASMNYMMLPLLSMT